MKNIFKLSLVLLAAFIISSCRNGDDAVPEDVFEHDEIGRVVLKVTNKADANDVQTVNVISGVADNHIHLAAGNTYSTELDFQIKHGDHYDSSEEIEEEKDHHFITYSLADANFTVLRSANDIIRTDNQKLGLKTEWTVNSVLPTGKVNIKLIHNPTTVNQDYPSASNQLGQTQGGETDVDIVVEVH